MKLVWLALLLFLIAVFSACQQAPEPLPVLRVGHAPHDHHATLYVAAMNPDYFKAHGGVYLKEVSFRKEYELVDGERPLARVLIDSSTGGKELVRRLAEDQFDISFGGVPAIISSIDKGEPIHVLSPVMTEGAGLIVRRDLPVANWAEFVEFARQRDKPLRIGYKADISVQNLIFEEALRVSGIPYSEALDDPAAKVSLVNLHGAKNLIPALEKGLIDGFVIMQPFLAMAEQGQVGKLVALTRQMPPDGHWRGHPCCALAGNDEFTGKYPGLAETFTALMMRAEGFIAANPEKSAEQVARWLDLPAAIESKSLPTIRFTSRVDEDWRRGIDFWVNSMLANGMLGDKVREAKEQNRLEALLYDMTVYENARRKLD